MLSVVIRVREGPTAKSREGRPWRSIAAEAWGTDILREHSFLWLVASRLAILMAGSVLTSLAVFYLARSMGLDEHDDRHWSIPLVALVAVGTVVVGRARGPALRPGRAQAGDLGELRHRRDRPGDRRGRPEPAGRLPRARCYTASRPGRSWRSTGR